MSLKTHLNTSQEQLWKAGGYNFNGQPGGDCRRSVCAEYLEYNPDEVTRLKLQDIKVAAKTGSGVGSVYDVRLMKPQSP